MPRMLAIAATFALLAPILLLGLGSTPAASQSVPESPEAVAKKPVSLSAIDQLRGLVARQQMRVRGEIIIRISPRRPEQGRQNLTTPPTRTTEYKERKIGNCLEVEGIAAVQTGSGNRLMLFLKDRRMIAVNLEKSCRSRDFYSGFYVERNSDGKLCVKRDKLQSRSGAQCEISSMRQLVKASS